jgi:hypothetical protein
MQDFGVRLEPLERPSGCEALEARAGAENLAGYA